MVNRKDMALRNAYETVAFLDEKKETIQQVVPVLAELEGAVHSLEHMNLFTSDVNVVMDEINEAMSTLVELDYAYFNVLQNQFKMYVEAGNAKALVAVITLLRLGAAGWETQHYVGDVYQASVQIMREQIAEAESKQ